MNHDIKGEVPMARVKLRGESSDTPMSTVHEVSMVMYKGERCRVKQQHTEADKYILMYLTGPNRGSTTRPVPIADTTPWSEEGEVVG